MRATLVVVVAVASGCDIVYDLTRPPPPPDAPSDRDNDRVRVHLIRVGEVRAVVARVVDIIASCDPGPRIDCVLMFDPFVTMPSSSGPRTSTPTP